MKKIFLIVFGLTIYLFAWSQSVTYTCPMHPEIHAAKPGNCPKCGMTLVKEKPKPVKQPVVKKKDPVSDNSNNKGQAVTYTCPHALGNTCI